MQSIRLNADAQVVLASIAMCTDQSILSLTRAARAEGDSCTSAQLVYVDLMFVGFNLTSIVLSSYAPWG